MSAPFRELIEQAAAEYHRLELENQRLRDQLEAVAEEVELPPDELTGLPRPQSPKVPLWTGARPAGQKFLDERSKSADDRKVASDFVDRASASESPQDAQAPVEREACARSRRPEESQLFFLPRTISAVRFYDAPDAEANRALQDKWEDFVLRLLHSTLRCYLIRDCWQPPQGPVDVDHRPSEGSSSLPLDTDSFHVKHPTLVSEESAIATSRTAARVSIMGSVRTFRVIMHPHCRRRVAWNLIGLALMCYDVFRITLDVFEPEDTTFFLLMEWMQRIFWTLDMPLSFATGFFNQRDLEMRPRVIAQKYATTWMPFDMIAVVPDWVLFFLQNGMHGLSALRVLRYIKLLRLIRLAKGARMLCVALEMVNSITMILSISIGGYVLSIIAWVHLSGCLWYAIGRSVEGGWPDLYVLSDSTLLHKYLISAHWALSQLQGSTEVYPGQSVAERFYAILVVVISIVILAIFQSKITNMMIELQSVWNARNTQIRALQNYLEKHQISSELAVKVKKYVQWKMKLEQKQEFQEDVLLQMIPRALRRRVVQETYGTCISRHSTFGVFQANHARFFERLCCEAFHQLRPDPDDAIYSYDQVCTHMYFVISGELGYLQYNSVIEALRNRLSPLTRMSLRTPDRPDSDATTNTNPLASALSLRAKVGDTNALDLSRVQRGQWLCEPVLWTSWRCLGDLTANTHASLLLLDGAHFGTLVDSYPEVRRSCAPHARRFIRALNQSPKVSDLFDFGDAFKRF